MSIEYRKVTLSDGVTLQILGYSDVMLTAQLWFEGKGFPGTHHHENEEVNVVIAGEFMATLGDRQFPAGVGVAVRVPSNVEHNMECVSGTASMISTWSPPRQDFIDKFAIPA